MITTVMMTMIIIGRIAATAAYCYRRSSMVGLSVGLSVGHVREPCKNG